MASKQVRTDAAGCRPLRITLIGPIVLVILLAAGGWAIVNEVSTRHQAATLVDMQGRAVLDGISRRVAEQRQAKEVAAQLLADQHTLALLVAWADPVELAELLSPLQAKLDLQRVTVYAPNGTEILHMGPRQTGLDTAPLVRAAQQGRIESAAAVTAQGLAEVAATPVLANGAVAGLLVVGSTLDGDQLHLISGSANVELAVFRDGRMITTTASDRELVHALTSGTATPDGRVDLALGGSHYLPVAKALPDGGVIVALVDTRPVLETANQRNAILVIGTAGILLALLLVGMVLTADIARPLESMLAVTRELERGDYSRRVTRSAIRELNELGDAVNHLASDLQAKMAELRHQAFHDSLTGLPNRALFMDRLEHALLRRGDRSLAVMFLDLDNFKWINDSLGHRAGDELLVAVAGRVRDSVRSADTVARLGGDEFTVLLEDIGGAADAAAIAEHLAERLRVPFTIAGRQVFTTASIGISLGDVGSSRRAEELVREADVAMYRAKTGGKAQAVVFDEAMNVQTLERFELELGLRGALERGELRVVYQPVVDLATGRTVRVEALLRWEHPAQGVISPLQFIPLAEETGLLVPIGQFVLETACHDVRQWQLERDGSEPPIGLSVNISPCQLQHAGLVHDVAGALRRSGLDPACFELEITEGALMSDPQATAQTLCQLKALGIQLAVDDFGTGYSSLSYLKRFPIDRLKIDRSFVHGLAHDDQDTAIVRAVIALASALNLSVTAEGVEHEVQRDRLVELGCQQAQGFYFSRPQPVQDLGRTASAWFASSLPRAA